MHMCRLVMRCTSKNKIRTYDKTGELHLGGGGGGLKRETLTNFDNFLPPCFYWQYHDL